MAEFIVKENKKKSYEHISCKIESDLLEQVKHIVLDNDLHSVNDFINQCIRFSIDHLDELSTTDEDWLLLEWLDTLECSGPNEDSDLH